MVEPIPVVYDVNVLVGAAAGGNSPFRSWPSPPPTSGNAFADCLGIITDAVEFGLWLSPHILDNTARVLDQGFNWDPVWIGQFLSMLSDVAELSGGGTVKPPQSISDWEDNRILDLAAKVGALLIVSDDADLTSMSPWKGTPILRPREFAAKVDGMRRHRRR